MEIQLMQSVESSVQSGEFSRDEVMDTAVLPDYIQEGEGERRYFLKQYGERRLKLTVSINKQKVKVLKGQWITKFRYE